MFWDLHNKLEDAWDSYLVSNGITFPHVYKTAENAILGDKIRFPNLLILCSSSTAFPPTVKYIDSSTTSNRKLTLSLIINTSTSSISDTARKDHIKYVNEILSLIYNDNIVNDLNAQGTNIIIDLVDPPTKSTEVFSGLYRTTISLDIILYPTTDDCPNTIASFNATIILV